MPDPLAQSDDAPLFKRDPVPAIGGTRAVAHHLSAIKTGSRRAKILAILSQREATLFEIAQELGVLDHRISGRITELKQQGYIEPTGQTRLNPETNSPADVYRLARSLPDEPAEIAGMPASLYINNDVFDRARLLPNEAYPGFPYSRRADTGGMRQTVRVDLIECPGCGGRLFLWNDEGTRKARCSNPRCTSQVWRVQWIREAGRSEFLALIKEHF